MPAAAAPSVPRPVLRVGPNAVLAIVAVAQFMVVLDATVVNVALPTIKRELGFSEESLSWVLNAYTLMFALVFTLIEADGWGWTSAKTLAGFAVAAALIVAFVVIERRHQDPLVPLRIFSNRGLAAADLTLLVVAAALFGVFYFCTLYLQQVLGYSALKIGVAYLPLSLTIIGASALASRFVDRFTPKPVLIAGLLVSTAGFVLLTRVSGHSDYASHVLPAFAILGVGLGMSFVPITIAAANGVAAGDSGLASGLGPGR